MSEGVQTQLMLDANILIAMEHCSRDGVEASDSTLYRHGLLEWVSFLRECSRLGLRYYLSPFFALQELPVEKVEEAAKAVDVFPRKFGLDWLDDEAARSPELAHVGRRVGQGRFEGMRDPERRMFAMNYAGLLLMLVVARDCMNRAPFVTFMHYLRLYHRRIDLVSMRNLSIARLVFGPAPPQGSEFHATWERIVRNFTDRSSLSQRLPRSPHQMDKAALNGAYDLMLLDAALVAEARGVEDQALDPWIVSADKKLAAMGEILHHTGAGKREAGRYVQTACFAQYGEYWARTEEVLSHLGTRARMDIQWALLEQRALGVVALAANGIGGAIDDAAYEHTQILTSGGGRFR